MFLSLEKHFQLPEIFQQLGDINHIYGDIAFVFLNLNETIFAKKLIDLSDNCPGMLECFLWFLKL